MNKAELVKAVEERLQSDRKTAANAVDNVIDLIVRQVAKGEKVSITGFGVFEKRRRGARMARNPATGASVKVKATSVPAFRPGTQFKDVVSGAKKLERVSKTAAASNGRKTASKSTTKSAAKSTGTTKSTTRPATKSTTRSTKSTKSATRPTAKSATRGTAAKKTGTTKSATKATGGRSTTKAAKSPAKTSSRTAAAKTTRGTAAKRTSGAKKAGTTTTKRTTKRAR